MNDLVTVSEEDCLFSPFPFLDITEILLQVSGSLGQIVLVERELHRSELGITLEVGLEVLQEHNLLGDGLWVVEEVVFIDLLNSLVTVTNPLDVDKVEQIGGGHNLGRVVEEHTESAVG